MISYLSGTVKNIQHQSITLDINGIGLSLNVARERRFKLDKKITFYAYMHWNQDKGPSLYGFQTEIEREVFLMIIQCPKIGPGIGLNILSKFSPGQFLEYITTQNEKQLSSVHGIGAKKSEQIIVQLKHKVQKLLVKGSISLEAQDNFVHWQNVHDVLISLNYSKPEITKAMTHVSSKYHGQNCNLDQLLRSALSFLSTKL